MRCALWEREVLQVRLDPYNVITILRGGCASIHNAILGRPWLHMIKVVLSNQLLQYPTPTGMADIRGDQPCPELSPLSLERSQTGGQRLQRQGFQGWGCPHYPRRIHHQVVLPGESLHRALALLVSRVPEQPITGPRPDGHSFLESLLKDGGSLNNL